MIGPLLIAMGFGYWLLTYATRHERGRLRKLGQWIATVMIVVSLAVSVLKLYRMCLVYCPGGGKGGFLCPFSAKGWLPGGKPAPPAA